MTFDIVKLSPSNPEYPEYRFSVQKVVNKRHYGSSAFCRDTKEVMKYIKINKKAGIM